VQSRDDPKALAFGNSDDFECGRFVGEVPRNKTIVSRVDYSDYLISAEIDRQRYRGMIDHLFLLSWDCR
jgi:hypothetical protein